MTNRNLLIIGGIVGVVGLMMIACVVCLGVTLFIQTSSTSTAEIAEEVVEEPIPVDTPEAIVPAVEEEAVVEETVTEETTTEQPTETAAVDTNTAEAQVFEVGDVVSIGDSVLVVLGWEELPGDEFSTPDEGNKFIAVELLIVNQSDSPASISSLLQMSVKDGTEQSYNPDLLASTAVDSAGIDGELSPGERARGKTGFQIPQTAQDLQFVFDADVFGMGRVFVNLGPAPIKVDPPASIAGEVEQQAAAIGDVVSIGDSVLVVLGWAEVPGDEFSTPDEGNRFLATELVIVNRSDSAASISTLLQMSLKDNTGQSYDPDLLASTATGSGNIDGELAPGERIRGKVGFQVPQTAQGLQFVFDASVFGTGKVFVNLGAEPVTVEPPAEIAGETEQQTFSIGDVVEIGTVALTVNEVTSPAGDEFNKPDDGNKFLVVDMTIENRDSSPAAVSTLLQMSVKDETGQTYDVDLSATAAGGGNTPDGELAPGEQLRGQIGFQVPADAAGLVLVFDAEVFGSGKIFVALS